MVSKKILLDYEEYRRLLSYEKKYSDLKEQMRIQQPEQKGEGRDQELEKIVLTNENQSNLVPKPQEILPPLTTPADVIDIDSDLPKGSPKASTSTDSSEISQKKPKKARSHDEKLHEKWWFLGKPTYKRW